MTLSRDARIATSSASRHRDLRPCTLMIVQKLQLNGQPVGVLGQLHPLVQARYEFSPAPVLAAELAEHAARERAGQRRGEAAEHRAVAAGGRAVDLVAANNVLAHVPDINDFLAGVKPDFVPAASARERLAHEYAALTFKEYALQDANTLEATQTMISSQFVTEFPLNDQEILLRHLHKTARDKIKEFVDEARRAGMPILPPSITAKRFIRYFIG